MVRNNKYPKVSIIVPVRNESNYIEDFLNDLLNQEYPIDRMEIILVDGLSTDGTREKIRQILEGRKEVNYLLLDNRYKYVPFALNRALHVAQGDIIIRMDVHARYPKDYIKKLVYWSLKLNADNVGGILKTLPSSDRTVARAIALAISHPFGVGNSLFRITARLSQPKEVDTVPFGCFRREVFEKVGYFDEDLIKNQDDELNARIKKLGGKIYLIPDIVVKYFARDNLSDLAKMMWNYGFYKPLVNFKLKTITSYRQLVPVLYLLSLISIGFGAIAYESLRYLEFALIFLYLGIDLLVSLKISLKNRNLKLAAVLFFVFPIVHFSYALGYSYGIFSIFWRTILDKIQKLKKSRKEGK